MNPKDSLPVILVSACDRATAESFISELIDNEVKEAECDYEEGEAVEGRIWRLVNKYYRADVLVRARGDGDTDAGQSADAHVIYFTPQECSAGSAACAEVRAAAKEAERAEVLVAALRAREADGALAAWATSSRYEPVLLLGSGEVEEDGEGEVPFGVEHGVGRVRAALHAHPWRGLLRLDRPHYPTPTMQPSLEYDSSSSGGYSAAEDEDEDETEAAAVERAEEFVRALGALGDARGAAGEGRAVGEGGEGDAARRARAEQVVAAFCRALGHDLDVW